MPTLPTFADLIEIAIAEVLAAPGSPFTEEALRTEGADVNMVLRLAAAIGENVAVFARAVLANLTFAASGEDLDRLILELMQVPRNRARASVVSLTLARTPGVGALLPAGFRVGSTAGPVFRTVTDVVFATNNGGPVEVFAVCESTGPAGNVAAGTVTRPLGATTIAGLTCTNVDAAAGGVDAEADAAYVDRARREYLARQGGTRRAIEFGALAVAGVHRASAIEVLDDGRPAFRLYCAIADAAGHANPALADEVERALDDWRALGVPVLVLPAVPTYVACVLVNLTFRAGVNTRAVIAEAVAGLVEVASVLAPGETLRRSALIRRLAAVDGLILAADSLAEPAGDVVADPSTVLRIRADDVEVSS